MSIRHLVGCVLAWTLSATAHADEAPPAAATTTPVAEPAPTAETPAPAAPPPAAVAPALTKPRKQDWLHVDSGFGASWAHGLSAFGAHGVVEPKVFIFDELAVGLRIDAGVQIGVGVQTGDTTSVETVMQIPVATLAKVEYFFFDDGIRPFIGLGAGSYLLVLQSISAGGSGSQIPGVYQGVGQYWGVAPQVGIDLNGVRLAATYNAILGGDLVFSQSIGDPRTVSRNYLALELTFKSFGFSL